MAEIHGNPIEKSFRFGKYQEKLFHIEKKTSSPKCPESSKVCIGSEHCVKKKRNNFKFFQEQFFVRFIGSILQRIFRAALFVCANFVQSLVIITAADYHKLSFQIACESQFLWHRAHHIFAPNSSSIYSRQIFTLL